MPPGSLKKNFGKGTVGRRSNTDAEQDSNEENLEVDSEVLLDNEEPGKLVQNPSPMNSDPAPAPNFDQIGRRTRRSLLPSDLKNTNDSVSSNPKRESRKRSRPPSDVEPKEKESKTVETDVDPGPNEKELNTVFSPRATRSRIDSKPQQTRRNNKKIDLTQDIGDNEVEVQTPCTVQKSTQFVGDESPVQVTPDSTVGSSLVTILELDEIPSTSSGIQDANENFPQAVASSSTSKVKVKTAKGNDEDKDSAPVEEEYYACTICFRAFHRLIDCDVHTRLKHPKEALMKVYNNPEGNHSFLQVGRKTPSLTFNRSHNDRSLTVLASRIHGKGLFTSSFIAAGEIIIEYTGEIISRKDALTRQHYYDGHHLDHYIMRMGHTIIDATIKGNCSKYINYSCHPNCETEQVEILGKRRVLIYSKRNIVAGEELTYDYKFTSDELIPCNCGAPNCRKFINANLEKLKLTSDAEVVKLVESLVGA